MLTRQNSLQKESTTAQTVECESRQWLAARSALNRQRQRLLEKVMLQESRMAPPPSQGDDLGHRQSKALAMLRLWRAMLERVDRAIARLDNGTYGICEYCGQQIPQARLNILPTAALCAACSQLQARNVHLIGRGTQRARKSTEE